MDKIEDKKSDIQPSLVPYICPKCKTGKLIGQCDERVFICNNPNCKAGMWLNYKE